jgi:hypothetical protein
MTRGDVVSSTCFILILCLLRRITRQAGPIAWNGRAIAETVSFCYRYYMLAMYIVLLIASCVEVFDHSAACQSLLQQPL